MTDAQESRIAQEIFELCEQQEGVHHDLYEIHSHCTPEKEEYRVYHNYGYCFDVSKQQDEVELGTKWYHFFSEHEGFKELSAQQAINLLKLSR